MPLVDTQILKLRIKSRYTRSAHRLLKYNFVDDLPALFHISVKSYTLPNSKTYDVRVFLPAFTSRALYLICSLRTLIAITEFDIHIHTIKQIGDTNDGHNEQSLSIDESMK